MNQRPSRPGKAHCTPKHPSSSASSITTRSSTVARDHSPRGAKRCLCESPSHRYRSRRAPTRLRCHDAVRHVPVAMNRPQNRMLDAGRIAGFVAVSLCAFLCPLRRARFCGGGTLSATLRSALGHITTWYRAGDEVPPTQSSAIQPCIPIGRLGHPAGGISESTT